MIQGQRSREFQAKIKPLFFAFWYFCFFVSRRNIPPELEPDKLCWLNFGHNVMVIKSIFFFLIEKDL